VEVVQRDLMMDGFVMRYDTQMTDDGLPPGEGVFLACSFWLVDSLLMLGRLDEARKIFRRLVGLCNDVGLLSEEYDTKTSRLVGNFPQAFSHIALINSAFNLTLADKPHHERRGHSAGARMCTVRGGFLQPRRKPPKRHRMRRSAAHALRNTAKKEDPAPR
jgi:hypothetical protein